MNNQKIANIIKQGTHEDKPTMPHKQKKKRKKPQALCRKKAKTKNNQHWNIKAQNFLFNQ